MNKESRKNLIKGLKNIIPVFVLIGVCVYLLSGCQTHKEEEVYRPECHGVVSLSDFIRLNCHQKRYAKND